MKNLRDIIIELREIRAAKEKELSYDKMLEMMCKNGDYLSKSTLSRMFGDNWEKYDFSYETTIRPIAKILVGSETIEETDGMDVKTMKSMLKYKIQRIEDLEKQINHLKSALDKEIIKGQECLIEAQEDFQRKLEFVSHQIELKDKRIDQLLDANVKLLNQLLTCPCRVNNEIERGE